MSIPNIGVGSPITIANINEIINGLLTALSVVLVMVGIMTLMGAVFYDT